MIRSTKKADSDTSKAVSGFTPRAINLLLPVGTLIAVMFAALIITGNGNLMNGSGMKALIWAVIIALLVASVLCVAEKVFTVSQVIGRDLQGHERHASYYLCSSVWIYHG